MAITFNPSDAAEAKEVYRKLGLRVELKKRNGVTSSLEHEAWRIGYKIMLEGAYPIGLPEAELKRRRDIDGQDAQEEARAEWEAGRRMEKKEQPSQARQSEPEDEKERVTINLSKSVLAFFRTDGPGYQLRINDVLVEYVREHSE